MPKMYFPLDIVFLVFSQRKRKISFRAFAFLFLPHVSFHITYTRPPFPIDSEIEKHFFFIQKHKFLGMYVAYFRSYRD